MDFFLRISTSFSEPWVAWTMAVLLALLVFADSYMCGVISESFKTLFATKERDSIFSETKRNTYGQLALVFYKAGIIAMMVYVIVFQQGHFSFFIWLLITLAVIVVGAIKYAAAWLLSYIFSNKQTLQTALLHYSNLITTITVLLYPIMLFILFAPFISHVTAVIMLALLGILSLAAWLWKAFQLFFTKIFAGFYIFLYLCTLELLPFAGILLAANSWIN